MNITEADTDLLRAASPMTLAAWWAELNRGGWPAEIPDPESAEYFPQSRRSKLMDWIMGRIGLKECLRAWNKESLPDENFDRWWESSFKPIHQALPF